MIRPWTIQEYATDTSVRTRTNTHRALENVGGLMSAQLYSRTITFATATVIETCDAHEPGSLARATPETGETKPRGNHQHSIVWFADSASSPCQI